MNEDSGNLQDEIEQLKAKCEVELTEDPSSPKFVFLAEILRRQGDLHRATEILINGLRNNPGSVTARSILAKIYFDRWMIDQAKNEMEKVIRVAPDNVDAAKMLIQIYRSEENYDKALEVCYCALVFNPEDDILANELKALQREGSHDGTEATTIETGRRANDIFESKYVAEEESPPDSIPEQLYTEAMANLYIDQGLYENAIVILDKLLASEPGNASIRTKLALAKSYRLSESSGFEVKKQYS